MELREGLAEVASADEDGYDGAVREVVEQRLITPHFQPIIDLQQGTILGWEILSRGPEPFASPADLFDAAARLDLVPALDAVCRQAALRTVAGFSPPARSHAFFLNVSLRGDARQLDGVMQAELAELGLDRRNFVVEITERASMGDYAAFERHIRHYIEQGFRIALANLGAGHSGLVTLVTCAPHFMKLDLTLSRDIHRHAYKQHLVKSLVAFANSVDTALIAEGVESWLELETLARLGVRYAQGYLFARPTPAPPEPTPETLAELRRLMRQFNYRESDLNETVGPLVVRCATLREGEKRGEDVDRFFRHESTIDHLALVRDEKPVGLITRQHFYTKTGGPLGYQLYQWRAAEELARPAPLMVEDSIDVTALAKLAMERAPDELYDPVIVTDGAGRLLGTVTIRQLIMRSNALEVQSAQGASPLTGLPGNRSIERWILAALSERDGCVLYADLDRFKEYNDCYGFLAGDEMIRRLAGVLARAQPSLGPDARLGHIGGDDFVIVSPTAVDPERVRGLCAEFDAAKVELFEAADVARGSFSSVDRRGQEVSVPLVTVSVAVVPVEAVQSTEHPGALVQMAASLKRKVKEMTAASRRSEFLFERRGVRPTTPP